MAVEIAANAEIPIDGFRKDGKLVPKLLSVRKTASQTESGLSTKALRMLRMSQMGSALEQNTEGVAEEEGYMQIRHSHSICGMGDLLIRRDAQTFQAGEE